MHCRLYLRERGARRVAAEGRYSLGDSWLLSRQNLAQYGAVRRTTGRLQADDRFPIGDHR